MRFGSHAHSSPGQDALPTHLLTKCLQETREEVEDRLIMPRDYLTLLPPTGLLKTTGTHCPVVLEARGIKGKL